MNVAPRTQPVERNSEAYSALLLGADNAFG
jgi:hypothetical protein